MSRFQGVFQQGGMLFGDVEGLKEYALKHDGQKFELLPYLPESRKQRKFYHGAVLPLWAFLNEWDYKDSENLAFLHEEAKKEFNGQMVFLDGKRVVKGKSTKGLLADHIENVILYLEEQYGIDRTKVLNPEHYKDFMDRVFSDGKYDEYVDYLLDLNLLKRPDVTLPVWRRSK